MLSKSTSERAAMGPAEVRSSLIKPEDRRNSKSLRRSPRYRCKRSEGGCSIGSKPRRNEPERKERARSTLQAASCPLVSSTEKVRHGEEKHITRKSLHLEEREKDQQRVNRTIDGSLIFIAFSFLGPI
ncbi:hypothetical protein CIPAW_11G139600 [Carya illinoinensis]|uniref:Uncharacterized protein n=1 Tax=Carya illinoinensis TaxID=32201 RepID=A0A8T1NZ72_CARIL|nr:hypothetical protein CIPAW_11G139600 [Carya illinoinensis]